MPSSWSTWLPGRSHRYGADTKVHAVVIPLDPATLGPLPGSLTADGNAYRIDLAYQPSNTLLAKLVISGDVILTTPRNVASLFFSSEGRSWERLTSQTISPTTIGATFGAPGYFLAAATTGPAKRGSGRVGTILIAVSLAVGSLILGVLAWTRTHRNETAIRTKPSRPRHHRS